MKLMRIKIFTRWNAKAWPTMIAMEGSILNFLFSLLVVSGGQMVVRWSTRWQVVTKVTLTKVLELPGAGCR